MRLAAGVGQTCAVLRFCNTISCPCVLTSLVRYKISFFILTLFGNAQVNFYTSHSDDGEHSRRLVPIGDAKSDNHSLRQVNIPLASALTSGTIGAAGFAALAEALPRWPKLERLLVYGNPGRRTLSRSR
eukprot:COSAG06_NODE_13559_length_1244_cov_2.468996_1_plen_129_part_00